MESNQLIENLIKVLDEEFKIYQSALEFADKKTKVIVEGNVDELSKMLILEQSFVERVTKLEELREKIILELSKKFEISSEKINITEILKNVYGEQVDIIKDYQLKIVEIIKKLKNINQLNGKLIMNSLEFVNYTINLFTNVGTTNNNYCKSGSVQDVKRKRYFDAKL
jgi:hypothetical protein